MKTITLTHLFIATCLFITGCSKEDLVERKPLSQLTIENFYKTEADAISAINAVYDPMQWGFLKNPDTPIAPFLIGDIMSDDAEKGGGKVEDQVQLTYLRTFRGNSTLPILQGIWQTLYRGILRSNLVLDHVPSIKMNETTKARILGEAKFCRAYYYFYLVRMFGGVPIIKKPLNPDEYTQTRASKEDVYAFIEKDLQDAANTLPEKNQSGANGSDLGRATKGAANGMLLRVYVYQTKDHPEKWHLAEQIAQPFLTSSIYRLNDNYADNFDIGKKNGPESVFEVQHMSTNGSWLDNEGSFDNVMQGSVSSSGSSAGYGWGFNCPTQNFVNEFEKNDPRLLATVIFPDTVIVKSTDADGKIKIDTTIGGNNVGNPIHSVNEKFIKGFTTGYMARKYVSTAPTVGGEVNGNGPSNYIVLRYADVLLMHAEAAYHNGNEAAALQSLNKVRNRVKLPAVTAAGPDLLKAIYHERRVELGLEALRFFDLVRQGRAKEVIEAADPSRIFNAGINEIFPIPQAEVVYSNGTIIQNPGYH